MSTQTGDTLLVTITKQPSNTLELLGAIEYLLKFHYTGTFCKTVNIIPLDDCIKFIEILRNGKFTEIIGNTEYTKILENSKFTKMISGNCKTKTVQSMSVYLDINHKNWNFVITSNEGQTQISFLNEYTGKYGEAKIHVSNEIALPVFLKMFKEMWGEKIEG